MSRFFLVFYKLHPKNRAGFVGKFLNSYYLKWVYSTHTGYIYEVVSSLHYAAGSRKNTLRRLRSRTISLFSKEGLGLGREGGGGGGFGEGGGVGEEGDTKKSGKPKEAGSTLPR